MVARHRRHLPAVAAALLLALQLVAAQDCGETNVRSRGAAGNGQNNDAWAFQAMENDGNAGIIYMSPGTYRLSQSLTLTKPIMAVDGAVFLLDAGVTLNLVNQPEHPLSLFFAGWGNVIFTEGTVRVYPEWWGARGDGVSDDAGAVLAAFNAAAATGNAMLYLTRSYGIGSELQLNYKASIYSLPTAKFVSVKGNSRGLTFVFGGYGFKNVLPHFDGFFDFCLRLFGADLAAMQLQTLSNCGDAIRFEAQPGNDINACLDNTLWFDKIVNSRIGINYVAHPACGGVACIYQGNQVVGNAIVGGPSSGQASAFGFFTTGDRPAWDSNQFDIAIVTPPTSNPDYVVYRAKPQSDREVVKIARLDPLHPSAKLFNPEVVNHMNQITITLAQQLQEYQLSMNGMLNLITIKGATTPLPGSPPVRCVNRQGDKGGFNGGQALVGNFFDLLAVPDSDWGPGDVRQFFIFHQMATGYLYQIKCAAPAGPSGPIVDCVQYNDNSFGNPGIPPTMNEVQLYLINLTGGTIKAGTEVPFEISVATLGNPTA